MKNIVIFGCRQLTIDIINKLRDRDDCTISAVVHMDAERDRVYGRQLVAEYCDLNDIRNIRFDNQISFEIIKGFRPDLIFSIYYRKIIKQNILNIAPMGCINIHPSLLPLYRGPAPSLWNILNGDKYAGITMHYMVEDVDAGDIIDQCKMEIKDKTGFELNRDLMNLGLNLFSDNIGKILSNTNTRFPQDHARATYCLPMKTSLTYLWWDNVEEILRYVKAFTHPYDGAITWNEHSRIKIWKIRVLEKRESFKPPGCYEIVNNNIVVQTNTLPIEVYDWSLVSGDLKNKGRFASGPPRHDDAT